MFPPAGFLPSLRRLARIFPPVSWPLLFAGVIVAGARSEEGDKGVELPRLWEYSAPLIGPEVRDREPSRAQKDPSVVYHAGRWHVFMTVKLPGRSAIEHVSFTRWEDAQASARTLLDVSDSDYFCAPAGLLFPAASAMVSRLPDGRARSRQDVGGLFNHPRPRRSPLLDPRPADARRGPGRSAPGGGLDYWIICDDQRAYLFLTSLDGRMWRLWTRLEDFPRGFDHWALALAAPVFEASHTYRLKGLDRYLTIIEENGRRYYKAYIADRLDGPWVPLADTAERPFASWKNIRPAPGVEPWTDNVSHGELIRDGRDETLTVDPADLRFVFQGMWDKDKSGATYGQFQWRIGLLTPVSSR
ncbi:MAG: non-reducing end alpha-L-arabinofuranosidase family hydrolase [Verrucomicrobia bacterium]|nr:non-reducing end alpha-L-arabinofuranosidase family hydrolase [Verrucomicrobiota bacterium]